MCAGSHRHNCQIGPALDVATLMDTFTDKKGSLGTTSMLIWNDYAIVFKPDQQDFEPSNVAVALMQH